MNESKGVKAVEAGNAPPDGVDRLRLLRQSRAAGAWYLLMGLLSPLNLIYIPSKLFIPGNAAATVEHIVASQRLFRLGFVTNIAGQIVFLFTALSLYELFKSVNKAQARAMVVLVIAAVPVAILNLLNQFAALLLSSGADYLGAFTAEQLQSLTMLFLDLQKNGVLIAEFFWGLWLLPLGLLVFKSLYFPKIFGILLVIGCFGYVADAGVMFLVPEFEAFFAPVIAAAEIVSEIPFILWLLIRGARIRAQ